MKYLKTYESIFDKNNTDELHTGQYIRLIKMNDPYALEPGSVGIIRHIDDIGNISVKWYPTGGLSLVPGDEYEIISEEEYMKIIKTKEFNL